MSVILKTVTMDVDEFNSLINEKDSELAQFSKELDQYVQWHEENTQKIIEYRKQIKSLKADKRKLCEALRHCVKAIETLPFDCLGFATAGQLHPYRDELIYRSNQALAKEDEVVANSAESVARAKWNAEADEYNQWDSLGQDEKDELIANS